MRTGGCDKSAYVWNLQTNQTQKMAAHDAPINNIFFIKELNMVVTSSWDKTLRYWDVRQSSGTPAHTQQLPERPFAMDVKYPLAVVGLAQRKIQVFGLDLTHSWPAPSGKTSYAGVQPDKSSSRLQGTGISAQMADTLHLLLPRHHWLSHRLY